jgi:sphingolipid delta-4 desaturase
VRIAGKSSDGSKMNNIDPHYARKVAILKEFPSVPSLYGHEPRTLAYMAVVMSLKLLLAYWAMASWAAAVALGVVVAPFLDAGILVIIHELSHNRCTGKVVADRLLSIAANCLMLAPISEIFRQHHSAHHTYLGDATNDVDAPCDWEVAFVGNSSWKKAVWLGLNMVFLPVRSLYKLEVRWNRFVVLNWVASAATAAAVYAIGGVQLLAFFGISLLCSQGAHPANARQLQRHLWDGSDEKGINAAGGSAHTFSYYGWSNAFFLNVGFHNEHHDFAQVPWTNLPALRAMVGPKYYPDDAAYHTRGTGDVWNFVFNPKVSLANFYSAARAHSRESAFPAIRLSVPDAPWAKREAVVTPSAGAAVVADGDDAGCAAPYALPPAAARGSVSPPDHSPSRSPGGAAATGEIRGRRRKQA